MDIHNTDTLGHLSNQNKTNNPHIIRHVLKQVDRTKDNQTEIKIRLFCLVFCAKSPRNAMYTALPTHTFVCF